MATFWSKAPFVLSCARALGIASATWVWPSVAHAVVQTSGTLDACQPPRALSAMLPACPGGVPVSQSSLSQHPVNCEHIWFWQIARYCGQPIAILAGHSMHCICTPCQVGCHNHNFLLSIPQEIFGDGLNDQQSFQLASVAGFQLCFALFASSMGGYMHAPQGPCNCTIAPFCVCTLLHSSFDGCLRKTGQVALVEPL